MFKCQARFYPHFARRWSAGSIMRMLSVAVATLTIALGQSQNGTPAVLINTPELKAVASQQNGPELSRAEPRPHCDAILSDSRENDPLCGYRRLRESTPITPPFFNHFLFAQKGSLPEPFAIRASFRNFDALLTPPGARRLLC